MKITQVATFLVEVPQKYPIAPYQSRYRPQSTTKSVLARVETDQGITGWGETPQRYLGEQFKGGEGACLTEMLAGRDPTDIAALYADWKLDGEHSPIEHPDDLAADAKQAGEGTNFWRHHLLRLPDGRARIYYNSGAYGCEQIYAREWRPVIGNR